MRMSPVRLAITGALSGAMLEDLGAQGGMAIRTRLGQALFHQGDPSDSIYLLVAGELRTSVSPASTDQEERTTLLLRAPALVGDRDTLESKIALETARCTTPSLLVSFADSAFLESWADDARLRELIGRDLIARYARTLIMAELEQTPLWSRIGAILEDLQRRGDARTNDPGYLALLTGRPHKSIVRALATLRESNAQSEEGTIDSDRLRTLGVPRVEPLFHSLAWPRE
jgi:CRP-like cAMP-binding protein